MLRILLLYDGVITNLHVEWLLRIHNMEILYNQIIQKKEISLRNHNHLLQRPSFFTGQIETVTILISTGHQFIQNSLFIIVLKINFRLK